MQDVACSDKKVKRADRGGNGRDAPAILQLIIPFFLVLMAAMATTFHSSTPKYLLFN